MDFAQIIGVAGVLLILFGAPLLYAAKAVGGFIVARIPKRAPVSFAGIFSAKLSIEWWKVFVLLVCLWLMGGGGGFRFPTWNWPSFPVIAPKPTLVVVLYEADNGEPPAYAAGAVNELRKAGRDARLMDDDPATGLNTVPAEVAPAIEPGRNVMGGTDGKGFALVMLAGARVVKAVALPPSKEAILEACQ